MSTTIDSIVNEMLADPQMKKIQPGSERVIAVLGGSFDPPHNGHVAAVRALEKLGYYVWVVPSMGHIHKLGTAGSYAVREEMARLAFGSQMHPVEAEIWPQVGLPIYTWDLLTEVRRRMSLVRARILSRVMRADEISTVKIVAAVGPDIDPRTWQGYPEIIRDGFDFVRLPEAPGTRHSSEIRAMIARQLPRETWGAYVPPDIADFISKYGLYAPRPLSERPDLTFLPDTTDLS